MICYWVAKKGSFLLKNKVAGILNGAWQKRISWKIPSNAWRLIDGVGDGLDGVTIDLFSRHVQVQFFKNVDSTVSREVFNWVGETLAPHFVVCKHRLDASGASLQNPRREIILGGESNAQTIVEEYGVRFAVDLLDTVNPGLFLDMRSNRFFVTQHAKDKEVLNLFAYTCSFGVHSRVRGAASVCNVDISPKILQRGRQNLQLNDLAVKSGEFYRGDSRDFLDYCLRRGRKFGLIILDPPSFSRGPKGTFSVRKELDLLVEQCCNILTDDGKLFVSTNLSSFSPASLARQVLAAGKGELELSSTHGADCDFTAWGKTRESGLAAALLSKK